MIVVQPAVPREVAAILTRLYNLSAREREVVTAVARLGVSPHTVAEHIDRACERIGVRGRKALVAQLFFDGSHADDRGGSAAPGAEALPQNRSQRIVTHVSRVLAGRSR